MTVDSNLSALRLAAQGALLARRSECVPEWFGLSDDDSAWGPNSPLATAVQANLETLGRTLDLPLAKRLSNSDASAVEAFYDWIDPILRAGVGAHRDFRPMYPNFPQQVASASEDELLRNAMEHYAGDLAGMRVLPAYEKAPRAKLEAALARKPATVRAAAPEALLDLLRSSLSANVSVPPADRERAEALADLAAAEGTLEGLLASVEIPNKENLALAFALAWKRGVDAAVAPKLKTPADILRAAAACAGGDASLAEPTKFSKFPRALRRRLVEAFERAFSEGDAEQALDALFLRRGRFLRLAETLHVGEFAQKAPAAFKAFKALRDGARPESFASKVDAAFKSGDADAARPLLRQRPGEMARRLADASRKLGSAAFKGLIDDFSACADKVATPVLLQARRAFLDAAASRSGSRVFLPKGGVARLFVAPEAAEPIDPKFASDAAAVCEKALLERFASFGPLGSCWIDPRLDKAPIPFGVRSASKSLKTLARGTALPAEGETTRLFLWWKENGKDQDGAHVSAGRVDLDLSCMLLDAAFNPIGHCSWTALRGGGLTHSGDITSAPNGASEFLDVDYAKLDPAVAYVALTAFSFTGQNFVDIPECYCGWMARNAPRSGEIYEPSTVEAKSDLASASTASMPAVLDVRNRMAIWADLSLGANHGYGMVERYSETISKVVEGLATMSRPTLGELFALHAQARGTLAADKDSADAVFSLSEGTTPYDFEAISTLFLADEPPAPAPAAKAKGPKP